MTKIRCAIYTRKSSEEGLDQEFNSLDAQHEACAAYIASQKHEGWRQLPARYDDGGISGGTIDRPGLKALFAGIDAGRVDMVVVYKIDRLTRSLADFAKLVERMEATDCSFVSVTQSFNTSSSMGRLTLNMLLSFAQFEREVTAERIRDKISASKKKGLWMGGLPPLGYDPHPDKTRRELVLNEVEAVTVERLFALYLEAGCLNATAKMAHAEGLKSKQRLFSSGRRQGGAPLSRGQIHAALTNPIYRGLIRHKQNTYPGLHPAIIEDDLWTKVQTKLQNASGRRRGAANAGSSSLTAPLLGKFRDEAGDRLTPTHAQKAGRRLRYYTSNALLSGQNKEGWRLPAKTFERAVTDTIATHMSKFAERHDVLKQGSAGEFEAASIAAKALAKRITTKGLAEVADLITDGRIAAGSIHIELDPGRLATLIDVTTDTLNPSILTIGGPFTCRKRGQETKIIAGERSQKPDATLIAALRKAHAWVAQIKDGISIKEIAKDESCTDSYTRRLIPLATLSPKIQMAILDGTHPPELTLEGIIRKRLPIDWREQEMTLGFAE